VYRTCYTNVTLSASRVPHVLHKCHPQCITCTARVTQMSPSVHHVDRTCYTNVTLSASRMPHVLHKCPPQGVTREIRRWSEIRGPRPIEINNTAETLIISLPVVNRGYVPLATHRICKAIRIFLLNLINWYNWVDNLAQGSCGTG
jgi:hypothetical protein